MIQLILCEKSKKQFLASYLIPFSWVQSCLGENKPRKHKMLLPDGSKIEVNVNHKRLQCVAGSPKCVSCGKVGNVARVDIDKGNQIHLNIYIDARPSNGLTMMTQDHIIPRSRGGADTLENLQTMCTNCNSKKGALLPQEWEDLKNEQCQRKQEKSDKKRRQNEAKSCLAG